MVSGGRPFAPTVGFIYPDHAAESDYPLVARQLNMNFPVVHIYGTDLHAVPELLDLGSPERLAEGARLLRPHEPGAVVWACTSGSFVYGPQGAAEQVAGLSEHSGTPASSTSFAFVNAAAALGVSKVAVAASYPRDIAELFVAFLAAHGIEVVSMGEAGIDTAAEVGRLTADQIDELADAHDHPDAEALLIPDTAMHTIAHVERLESRLGKAVLTANQVTVWEGLRLIKEVPDFPGLGRLFRRRHDDAGT
ncbi:maleate cis-trans isomerase family protein [Mycobacteroides saopaulense]|uniref:Maleate cis-trans isomerase n=1 Tax=Mycobacteroides saopaulense TaxID=1578165 RepID=A0ABX3C2Q1_9MYCO|nr:aspartate/glutamate racemase family protein [Mycobacteroides saopaulense]OHT85225.1 maleate cis-trans isomerase [Mycobacteroides saopaulense]OHU11376.1 maleate cis-trans isomerase [Mycobacteroides saopaulense]